VLRKRKFELPKIVAEFLLNSHRCVFCYKRTQVFVSAKKTDPGDSDWNFSVHGSGATLVEGFPLVHPCRHYP
jgi:hypothetical protein